MAKTSPKSSTLRGALALLYERIASAEEGATAIEYSLIASGIGLAVATTVMSVGSSLKTNFYDKLAALF